VTRSTARPKAVLDQQDSPLRKLSGSKAARRGRWLVCFTVCALFALSWSMFIALILLAVAGIQQGYRWLLAH
jgi:hypothetical protein